MEFEHEIGNLLQRVAAAHHLLDAGRRAPEFLMAEIKLLFHDLSRFVTEQWAAGEQRERLVHLVERGAALRNRLDGQTERMQAGGAA